MIKFILFFIGILASIIFLDNNLFYNNNVLLNYNISYIDEISLDPPLVLINNLFNDTIYHNILNDYNKNSDNSIKSVYRDDSIIHSHMLYTNKSYIMNTFHNDYFTLFVNNILSKDLMTAPINHPLANVIMVNKNNYSDNNYTKAFNMYLGESIQGIYKIHNDYTSNFCFELHKYRKCLDVPSNSLLLFDSTKINHYHKIFPNNTKDASYYINYITSPKQDLDGLIIRYLFTQEGPNSLFSEYLF